jgi:hypothetical protein
MPCDWTWVTALSQCSASGNNGDEFGVLTGMKPPTGVLPHRPRTRCETWETNPNVEIFTPNINLKNSQKSNHLYIFQKDNWEKQNWTKNWWCCWEHIGELREHLRREIHWQCDGNILRTWWEEPKKKSKPTLLPPKRKKPGPLGCVAGWSQWLSRNYMLSLFCLSLMGGGRGIICGDMVWVAQMFCCRTDDWGS